MRALFPAAVSVAFTTRERARLDPLSSRVPDLVVGRLSPRNSSNKSGQVEAKLNLSKLCRQGCESEVPLYSSVYARRNTLEPVNIILRAPNRDL